MVDPMTGLSPWEATTLQTIAEAAEAGLPAPTCDALVERTGCNAVSTTVNLIKRLEQHGAPDLSHIVADGLRDMSVIATALADGRIDHTEERDTTAAADHLIATLIPLSSARERG